MLIGPAPTPSWSGDAAGADNWDDLALNRSGAKTKIISRRVGNNLQTTMSSRLHPLRNI
jgi:hypothetical protein